MEGRAAEMNEFMFFKSKSNLTISFQNQNPINQQFQGKSKSCLNPKFYHFLFCQWQNYNPSTVFALWVKIDTHTAYQIYIFKTIGSATEVRARESVIVDLSNDSHSSQATSTLSNTPNLNIGFLRKETLQC